jgi:hypothetical protein
MEPRFPPSFRCNGGWTSYDHQPLIVSSEADGLVAASPNYLNHLPILSFMRAGDDLSSSPNQTEREFSRTGVFQLSKIPPEVRLKIYREYFIEISKDVTQSHRQYPNLLAALRGQPLLYRELLETYHHCYNFRLGSRSEVDFYNNVSMELVRSIQHLTLEYADRHTPFPVGTQRESQHIFNHNRNIRPILHDFRQFIKYVWYEPIVAKIHQAMNLRNLVVSVRSGPDPAHSTVLDLLDLVFLYFSVLEKFTVYSLQEGNFIESSYRWSIHVRARRAPSLEAVKGELIKKKEVTFMETYNEGPEDHITGIGFECHWVGKDGKKKCFVMETRVIKDAVQIFEEIEQKQRV